jgi:hypothetical protein
MIEVTAARPAGALISTAGGLLAPATACEESAA